MNKTQVPYKTSWVNSKESDIFWAGVALFIMMTKLKPFQYSPEKTDPYYKYFFDNNESRFWDKLIKENRLSPDSFTPLFMDFMNRLLAYDPKQRITTNEIKNHPWFIGDTLTMDELREQMMKRIPKKEELKRKIEEKIQIMKHKKAGTDAIFYGVLPFRSLNFNVLLLK